MESVVRLAAAAVAAALCAVVVKQHAREVGAVLALAAGALLLGAALGAIEEVRALADELGELIGLSPAVLAPVLKTVGIAILTRIAAELCRDAGEGGIAAAAEHRAGRPGGPGLRGADGSASAAGGAEHHNGPAVREHRSERYQ